MDLLEGQSLIYGATNVVPYIRTIGKRRNVDHTTILRIHGVKLDGQQIPSSTKCASLFALLAEKQYFSDLSEMSEDTSANALAWMCYDIYRKTKDGTHKPTINPDNEDVLEFQEAIYTANNELYDLIVRLGFTQMCGCYIHSSRLKASVVRFFTEKEKHRGSILDATKFAIAFSEQYNVDYYASTSILGFIDTYLLKHINAHLMTIKNPDRFITDDEFQTRLNYYSDPLDRSNARHLFVSKHTWDSAKKAFVGVYFHREPEPFNGNTFEMENVPLILNGFVPDTV